MNHDSPNHPSFSVDNATTSVYNFLDTNAVSVLYYIDGIVAGLNIGSTPTLQFRHVLTGDISFIFETGAWRGSIGGGATGSTQPDSFASGAASFLISEWNQNATLGNAKSGDQISVMIAMYSFMMDYTIWANECPHFGYHSLSIVGHVPEWQMLDSYGGSPNGFLTTFSSRMVQ